MTCRGAIGALTKEAASEDALHAQAGEKMMERLSPVDDDQCPVGVVEEVVVSVRSSACAYAAAPLRQFAGYVTRLTDAFGWRYVALVAVPSQSRTTCCEQTPYSRSRLAADADAARSRAGISHKTHHRSRLNRRRTISAWRSPTRHAYSVARQNAALGFACRRAPVESGPTTGLTRRTVGLVQNTIDRV